MSIKIGITGGIGSGKSIVSHLLEIAGIPMYVSDIRAKCLMQSDSSIHDSLVALLGSEIYHGKSLNKTLLAKYIFNNSESLSKVNSIIHPVVKDDFVKWSKIHENFALVGMEAAILIEAGFAESVDKVVMVYTPLETRIRRAVLRDSSSRKEVLSRIHNQMPDDEKMKFADFVIRNVDEEPLIPQVFSLLNRLS